MKVMETVNIVIDESSESSSDKFSEEIPKEILPPEPRVVQEIVEQEPTSPSTPDTPSVVEDLAYISTSSDSETYVEQMYGMLESHVQHTVDRFAYIQGQITALSSQIEDMTMEQGSELESE